MSSLYIFAYSMNQNRQDYTLRPQCPAKAEYIVVETKLQLAARTRAIENVFRCYGRWIPFEVSKKRPVPAFA
jgi:hypothetical protein